MDWGQDCAFLQCVGCGGARGSCPPCPGASLVVGIGGDGNEQHVLTRNPKRAACLSAVWGFFQVFPSRAFPTGLGASAWVRALSAESPSALQLPCGQQCGQLQRGWGASLPWKLYPGFALVLPCFLPKGNITTCSVLQALSRFGF